MRCVATLRLGALLAVLSVGHETAAGGDDLVLEPLDLDEPGDLVLEPLADFDDDLVLEPLRIEEADFRLAPVTVVTDAAGSDRDNAIVLDAPWSVRGQLERRENRFYELRIEGDAELWHVEAAGENLAYLQYQDAGGASQQMRRVDRGTGSAVMSGLYLAPGSHWLVIRAGGDNTEYTLRALPLGPPDPYVEREPNDDATRAHRLIFGYPRTGYIYERGDVDFYRFSLGATEHLALSVQSPPDLTLRVHLYEMFTGSTRRIATGRGLGPGDTVVYRAQLLAGDYAVELRGERSGDRSDYPYIIRLERGDPFELAVDLEPNNDAEHARPLPSDLVVAGTVGQWGGEDWYLLPERTQETHLVIHVLEAPDRFQLALHEDGARQASRLLEHDREAQIYRAVLPADATLQARVRGRGDYRLRFDFDPGPTPLEGAALPIELSFGPAPPVPAGFWPEAQSVALPVRIANRGNAALELRLDAVTSHHHVRPLVGTASLDLAAGADTTVPVELRIGPDIPADQPVRIGIAARGAGGAHATASWDLLPQCAVEPQNPTQEWLLPSELLGSFNMAWTALGANPLAENDRERRMILPVFDGYTPLDGGWNRPASELPAEFTVRLAGDVPVPVAGVTLHPMARLSQPDHQARDFDVLLSDDGVAFRAVYSGALDRRLAEQAFVFDEPIEARYARLRVRSNHLGATGRIGLGEWKVIAAPGFRPDEGRGFNIASADFGAHVVWADPTPPSYSVLERMLTEEGRGGAVGLREPRPLRWVISFHQQRAARITGFQWVDPPERTRGDGIRNVTVAVSMDSPLGPWTELGHWELERTAEGVTPFTLPEPVWARFVLFTSPDPDERGEWQYPLTLRVIEQPSDDSYTSILAEWGHYSREAIYEYLTPPVHEPFVRLAGVHGSRDSARPLAEDETYAGAVLLGETEEWHRIEVGPDLNLLSLNLRGRPYLRVSAVLEDESGQALPLERAVISPREMMLRAEVEPGTHFLRVYEPPRSVIFAWDNSGSMGPYRATVYQALQRFAEQVRPGIEYVNFLPFQHGMPRLLHPEWSDQSYLLQATLTNYHRRDGSSNSEPALLVSAQALADRPGARAILLLTDAESFGFQDSEAMWQAMDEVRPQIFSVELHAGLDPRHQQHLMRSWASINAGHHSLFRTQEDVDVAFDRASCYLRRPARYMLTAEASFEAPPEPTMYEALMEEGRVVTHGILFDIDSARLRAESYPLLRQMGEMLQAHIDLRLRIEGHTDNTGSAAWNQALSERRAESVRTFLVERYAIEPSRLESVGYGEDRPTDSNDTAQGRQNNRRVELVRLE